MFRNPNPLSAVQRTFLTALTLVIGLLVTAMLVGGNATQPSAAPTPVPTQQVLPAPTLTPVADTIPSAEDVFRYFMTTLPACEVEDGANCSWDASSAGNGMGTDFFDLNGTAFYLEGQTLVGYDEDRNVAVRCSTSCRQDTL